MTGGGVGGVEEDHAVSGDFSPGAVSATSTPRSIAGGAMEEKVDYSGVVGMDRLYGEAGGGSLAQGYYNPAVSAPPSQAPSVYDYEAPPAAAQTAAEANQAARPEGKGPQRIGRSLVGSFNPVSWFLGGIGRRPSDDEEKSEADNTKEAAEDGEDGEEYYDDEPGLVKVDPQAIKQILSSRVNQWLAGANVAIGILYLTWRIMRGLSKSPDWLGWTLLGHNFFDPDDPERGWSFKVELEIHWFFWLILLAEALLMIGVWLTHVTRLFPIKRTRCTMNDLIDVDYELSKSTHVSIVLPTHGEELSVLREVILSTMSLHLWPGKLDVRRNLRLIVVDDVRRSEVKLLLALCYRFSSLFCNNRKVRQQIKMEGKGDMTLVGFYEFYLQCTAGFARAYSENFEEVFEVASMIQKICRENCVPSDWDGLDLPSGRRVEPTTSFIEGQLRLPRTREDFDEIRNVLYVVYFARPNAGEPAVNPFAGCVNSVLFPDDPADTDILGDARFVVLNDANHSLQPEYLQRTMPYFFELHKTKRKVSYRICKDVAFVQVALRYKDLKAKDPLAIRAKLYYDIKNVGRDGVGATFACRHGCMYRVDVLQQGKSARGRQLIPLEEMKEYIGHGVGLSELTRVEALPTTIMLFQRGYRSIYVNEAGETLSMCVEPTQDLDARIQEVFEWYMSCMEVLVAGSFTLIKSRYTSFWHRVMVFEELWHGIILGVATELVVACIVLYCILWRLPFNTHGMEFLLYFLTYYVSAALPTAVGLNWKLTAPDHAFRSVQLGVATAYVPIVAFVGGGLSEASRIVCSRTGRRQFIVDGAPTWPLFATVVLLICSVIITFIKWAQHHFQHSGLWLTASVMAGCALGMLYPSAARGLRFKGLANFYMRYFALAVLIVIMALWQGAAPGGGIPKTGGKKGH